MVIDRNQIFTNKKIIASEIASFQRALFNPENLALYKDEEYLYLNMFDLIDYNSEEYFFYDKIINLECDDIEKYSDILSIKIIDLLNHINVNNVIIVSHLKMNLIGNRKVKNKFLLNAYINLEKIVGSKKIDEAIVLNIGELIDLIKSLFWIVRLDSSAQEFIYMFDNEEKIQLYICKYGNLHIREFKKENLDADVLSSLGWKICHGIEKDKF